MNARRLGLILLGILLLGIQQAEASNWVHRSFWQPYYQGQRLAYCTLDHQHCGLEVATRYCRIMGYEKASKQSIANNVGVTHFFESGSKCVGWRCDGFKTIQCSMRIPHTPPKPYHYRLRRFFYPHYNFYRVDWCYDGCHHCGRRAAYSFCRRMGYLETRGFRKEAGVAATQALGNQKLCFGNTCNAFAEITCYR